MPRAVNQEPYRRQLLADVESQNRRIAELRDGLNERQLLWPPPSGGWCIAQICEHLIVAGDSYLNAMQDLINRSARNQNAAAKATWKPRLGGALLVWSFTTTWKMKAPKMYTPASTPRAHSAGALLERQDSLKSLLESAADIVWVNAKMVSPVTSLVRLNLGDAFSILVRHTDRHLGQIDRVRNSEGFPGR